MFNDNLDIEIGYEASLFGKINENTINTVFVPSKNKSYEVNIPNNILVGQKIRLQGLGKKGFGKYGDLLIRIDNANIFEEINLILSGPENGTTNIEHYISILDRKVNFSVPNNIQEGTKIKLKGAGLPISPYLQGDVYIQIKNIIRETVPNTQHTQTSSSPNKKINSVALNDLIGLNNIKKEISSLLSFVQVQNTRKKQGFAAVPISLHCVFSGNPGTGKTTVARILAEEYRKLGILKKGHLVEVSRKDLVAQHIGHTAIKTQEKIDEAMGGVLFIDEAYTLVKKDNDRDFGQEAVDTILKAMEDYREDFIVIVAGYDNEMELFINSNPGLKSRFSRFIHFEDYTSNEMIQIFKNLCNEYQYKLSYDSELKLQELLNNLSDNKPTNFANARDVRNIFEKVIQNQAVRVSKGHSDILLIKSIDFDNVW